MTRSTTLSLVFLVAAAPLAACENHTAPLPPDSRPSIDLGPAVDARPPSEAAVGDAGPKPTRTMVKRPLFGLAHAQNLIMDPNFSVRFGGMGTWMTATADPTQGSASWSASLMSDSPSGIAMPVGKLADNSKSTKNYELDAFAQIPGGPGPFNLRVWISTLDAAASATLTGVTVGVLTSLNGKAIVVTEEPTRAQVIGGRTWHLYSGTISQSLTLGGFVLVQLAASPNSWLLQAPEFIPQSIDPAPTTKSKPRPAAAQRPMTDYEKKLVERYRGAPRISVPAGHRSRIDPERELHR